MEEPALPNFSKTENRYLRQSAFLRFVKAAAVVEGELNSEPFFLWYFIITASQSTEFPIPSEMYAKYALCPSELLP